VGLRDEIDGALGRVILVHPRLQLDERGFLRPIYTLSFRKVEDCCYYALALLVSRDNNLAIRIGRCGRDGCKAFFFDPRSGVGAPRRYCSPAHKNRQGVSNHRNVHKRTATSRRAKGRISR
jgi:hypothetical protein